MRTDKEILTDADTLVIDPPAGVSASALQTERIARLQLEVLLDIRGLLNEDDAPDDAPASTKAT